ncbi:MAG TPA: hypothetical protein VFR02_01600, partial [bacterium]|nr:hypothetical protein [bacterium]
MLDPKATVFADLAAWTDKTTGQLVRLPKARQLEKADALKEAIRVRISRALIGLTFGRPSIPPAPDQYGWYTARAVCLNRGWKSGMPLGRRARHNYLVLAAIFYRVNHGMEEMAKAQAIVEAVDRGRYAAKHGALGDTLIYDESGAAARVAATQAAAAEEAAARLAAEEEARQDDNPPASLEDLDPDGTNPGPVLLAQHEWRLRRTMERMKAHYAKQTPKNPEQEKAFDRLHLWKRFVYSHLLLARAILDGERCDDAYALEEDLVKGRLSRLTLNYPNTDMAPGEETMRSLHACLRLSDAVYAIPTGSSAGAATANAAAQVTTRLGADEAPMEETMMTGSIPTTVRTAPDPSTNTNGEPPKKRRGRPPKNAVRPVGPTPRRPPSKPAAKNANKGGPGRPPKGRGKKAKAAAAAAAAAKDLPMPLPLGTKLDGQDNEFQEEMNFYNRIAREEDGAP